MLLKSDTSGGRGGSVFPRRGERPTALGPAGAVVVAIFTVVALSGNARFGSSVSITAMVAGVSAGVCWTLVLLYDRVPPAALRSGAIFVAFIAWMLSSLFLNGATKQGLQFIVVQIAFAGALLLAATARYVVGGYLDIVVARCIRLTASAIMVVEFAGAIDSKFQLNVRAMAIVALIGVGWFLAEYRTGRRTSLRWALAAFLGIAVTLSRTATLAAFVLVVIAMLSGSERHRARNAGIAALMLLTGFVAVTSWAPLRDRFTQGDTSLSVGGLSINAEGRTKVWQILYPEALRDPVMGRGPGSASARSLQISPTLDHPHNDYLRVFYDFGAVGFGLLVWFAVRSGRLLVRIRKRRRGLVPPLAALNVAIAILIVMATDNPLDYSFVMIPFGALIGLGLGYVVQVSTGSPAHVA